MATTIINKTTARTFINTLEAYAKRSKYITIVHKYIGWHLCGVQVNVTKENKVVREMVQYIASVLPYKEEEDMTNGAIWYKSHAEEQEEDVWEAQCCVSHY